MTSSRRTVPKENGLFAGARRLLAGVLFICLASILANCDERPVLSQADVLAEDERIVFGRLKVVTSDAPEGVDWKKSSFWTPWPYFKVLILPRNASEAISYKLEYDGTFYWNLEPGEYVIAGFYWAFSAQNARTGRVWAAFTVSPDQPATYVGTLAVAFSRNRYNSHIQDDYETGVARFKERFPDIVTEPDKNLLHGGEDPTQAEFVRNICAPAWGVDCGGNYRGVRPIFPKIGGTAFPETTSLRPTFQWEPSTKSDVSYDLVVYDTFAFSPNDVGTEYMQGPVAFYREDLKDNRYEPDLPLRPNTRYFWSVRFRQRNIVSSWSTFSYELFYIIGYTKQSSLVFNFRTPDK